MKYLLAAVLSCLLAFSSNAFAAEAAKDKKDAAKPINKICPVEKGEVDPALTTEHKGRTVGFCCAGCVDEFKKDPAKYMAIIAKEAPAKDAPAKDAKESKDKKEAKLNTQCPVTGDEADPKLTAKHKGRTIAFCCEDCVKDFKKDPEKYVAKLDKEQADKAPKKEDGKEEGAEKPAK